MFTYPDLHSQALINLDWIEPAEPLDIFKILRIHEIDYIDRQVIYE